MGILHRAVISVFSVKAVPQYGLLIRCGWQRTWVRAGATAAAALDRRLAAAPLHEGQAVRALAAALPPDAQVVIGSSMP